MRPRTWPAQCPRAARIRWRNAATETCPLCRRRSMIRTRLEHGTGFPDTRRDVPISLKSNTQLQLLCTIRWPRVHRQGVNKRRGQAQAIGRAAVPIVCYIGNPHHISVVRQNPIVSRVVYPTLDFFDGIYGIFVGKDRGPDRSDNRYDKSGGSIDKFAIVLDERFCMGSSRTFSRHPEDICVRTRSRVERRRCTSRFLDRDPFILIH